MLRITSTLLVKSFNHWQATQTLTNVSLVSSEIELKITTGTIIFLADFAENYQFVVQDEVQGFHWTRLQCSIHQVVIYHKDNGELRNMSFCIMSDKTTPMMLLLFMSLKKKNLLTYCKKN